MAAPPIQYCRSADGTSIAYWTLGEGPTVVVNNASVVSHLALEWEVPAARRFYEPLAERFQVVRFDPRCSGLSGAGALTVERVAEDLSAVVDAIGQDRVALVTATTAVTYVFPFARRFPDRLRSVVSLLPLLNVGRADETARAWGSMLAGFQNAAEILARTMDPAEVDPPEPLKRLLRGAWEEMAPFNEGRLELATHLVEEVEHLRVPLLAVDWPETDGSQGPELASRVPEARLVTRAGRAHPWYDPDPESLIALIRDFILEHAEEPAVETRAASNRGPASTIALSPRELEVVALVAAGKTNGEIAETLVIAPGTVGRHVSNLLAKTGRKNRVELTGYAHEQGLTGS